LTLNYVMVLQPVIGLVLFAVVTDTWCTSDTFK
jgi:hypothetical protein